MWSRDVVLVILGIIKNSGLAGMQENGLHLSELGHGISE